jgi:hypothetical protein
MPASYPYIISNNKIDPILTRIRSASKPPKFSRELLGTWGFGSSNDRAMGGILKELGFLTEAGAPTEYYDRLRDPNDWKFVLGERMRALYADLFAIDGNIPTAPEIEIKGAISRVTGKDDETVKRYYSTFKTLASLANFEGRPAKNVLKKKEEDQPEGQPSKQRQPDEQPSKRRTEYHYNIQIHLPVTTDVSVYNAIFKSLKENLEL